MAWLESHTELINHPKTLALGERMGWNKYEAVGRLHAFWAWVMDYAPTGDLRRFSAAALSNSVGLSGDEGERFVEALVQCGWVDKAEGVFRVHDWPQYAGRYLRNWKFKRRPDLYAQMLDLYGLADMSATSLRQLVDESETNSRQNSDLSATNPRLVEQPTNQPTNQPKAKDSLHSVAVRKSAKTTKELAEKDYILRTDAQEFELFLSRVRALIEQENAPRRGNPFSWDPPLVSFEADMKMLIYKPTTAVKHRILTEALNVLGQKYNWPEYVLLAIKATVRASIHQKIRSPYQYTYGVLMNPSALISNAADGSLAKPLQELLSSLQR